MITFGKPFTPSEIIETEEIPATRVIVSYGGGMGGSRCVYYTTDEFDLNSKFIKINTNYDDNTTINTNNIVMTTPVKLIRIRIKNTGNQHMSQKIGTVKDYYYELSQHDSYEISDSYKDNPDVIHWHN